MMFFLRTHKKVYVKVERLYVSQTFLMKTCNTRSKLPVNTHFYKSVQSIISNPVMARILTTLLESINHYRNLKNTSGFGEVLYVISYQTTALGCFLVFNVLQALLFIYSAIFMFYLLQATLFSNPSIATKVSATSLILFKQIHCDRKFEI